MDRRQAGAASDDPREDLIVVLVEERFATGLERIAERESTRRAAARFAAVGRSSASKSSVAKTWPGVLA